MKHVMKRSLEFDLKDFRGLIMAVIIFDAFIPNLTIIRKALLSSSFIRFARVIQTVMRTAALRSKSAFIAATLCIENNIKVLYVPPASGRQPLLWGKRILSQRMEEHGRKGFSVAGYGYQALNFGFFVVNSPRSVMELFDCMLKLAEISRRLNLDSKDFCRRAGFIRVH